MEKVDVCPLCSSADFTANALTSTRDKTEKLKDKFISEVLLLEDTIVRIVLENGMIYIGKIESQDDEAISVHVDVFTPAPNSRLALAIIGPVAEDDKYVAIIEKRFIRAIGCCVKRG
mgnify:CR=1 FL=1